MTTSGDARRVTQRQIAALAGVSQATVSLVLNGRTDTTTRIPQETRDRVLEVIRRTSYAADPAARSLAGKSNDLIGVFTYEHAFPTETSDFYVPLLTGIETAAEGLGLDLLVFTSARVEGGRRRLLHEGSRLRLADGCVLLGREMDHDELVQLVDSGYPFVAVGRRDGDERIPFVGADYRSAAARLAELALAAGHRDVVYAKIPGEAESTADRLAGFREVAEAGDARVHVVTVDADDVPATWAVVRDARPTLLVVEDPGQAQLLAECAARDGVVVPDDLSMIALGEAPRAWRSTDFTRLTAPRSELARRAVEVLADLIADRVVAGPATRILLDCDVVPGSTLAPPRAV